MSVSITHSKNLFTKNIEVPVGTVGTNEKGFYFSVPIDYDGGPFFVRLNYEKTIFFNQLYLGDIDYSDEFKVTVHYSEDNNIWQRVPVIHTERAETKARVDLPLTAAKSVQIIFSGKNDGGVPSLKVGRANILRYANPSFKASSEENRLWVAENLTDKRDDYGWASQIHEVQKSDSIEIDFGRIFYFNELRLRATNEFPNFFPVGFSILSSMDKNSWQTLRSESEFYAVSGAWYSWKTPVSRCRYLKLVITDHFRKRKDQFISRILEADFFAVAENSFRSEDKFSSEILASEVVAGAVVLAEPNSVAPSTVVQGNDPRLRNASTEFLGIMQFAKDGEQKANRALQSNDSRLKKAGVSWAGIVQLAKDGETAENKAVQGNDSRLKTATTDFPGIVQLAKDKEEISGKALQSNDSRLKTAGVSLFGITQFAAHGESSPLKALQADDPRLQEGNETLKGRVQFARDRESSAFKALQSNDSRLTKASETEFGFAVFSRHGEKNPLTAVQADDPRLENQREALPHTHDYAPLQHDFNSHKGKLSLQIEEEHQPLMGIEAFSEKRYPLHVKNSQGHAAFFQGGMVARSEKHSSVMALADTVTAVEARSRRLPAGVFLSEKDFALHLPNTIGQLRGSGKSLKVEGTSEFLSPALFFGATAFLWDKFTRENFLEGDVLAVNKEGEFKKISDTRETVVGIYARHYGVLLNPKKKKKEGFAVAFSGVTKVRVVGNVTAGDTLGFLFGNDGVAKRVEKNSANPIVGIALENHSTDKEDLINCLLRLK